MRADDEEFLYRVYASTRAEELARLPWSEAQKQAFLRQQFGAQHRYYHEVFAEARFDVVERGGQPIGRLYVDRRAQEIHVIDIALVPEERGRGVGRALMREILREAAALARPVGLYVEPENPAMRWYQRLGFVERSDTGVYREMVWSPAAAQEKIIS